MGRKKRGPQRENRHRKRVDLQRRMMFLIVCEGTQTEPVYFEAFRIPKRVRRIVGTGDNTLNLVKEAIRLSKEGVYEQVWVVMDKDEFPIDHFNRAIELAEQHGIQIAYSNEAFELWYLLHFDFHQAAISRKTYSERLSKRLGFSYKKNDPRMYDLLESEIETAIKHASKLLRLYGENHNPGRDNPCTSVHLLVQELHQQTV